MMKGLFGRFETSFVAMLHCLVAERTLPFRRYADGFSPKKQRLFADIPIRLR
jgi:hypothetical protein